MDRKVVKPALPGGRIFNPEHRNFLPPEGVEVLMSPYWIALEQRKDIIASDPAPVTSVVPPSPAA